MLEMLCKLFNMCVRHGLPKSWQDVHVTSLHKQGPRNECNNYRGLSVMNVFVKLLGIMLKDIVESISVQKQLRAKT